MDKTIKRMIEEFKDQGSFSREALYDFYSQSEPNLNENTFRWRIHNLKANNIITPLSRNEFAVGYKETYQPTADLAEQKLFQRIRREFSYLKMAVWSTQIVNEFMLHQPMNYFTLVEVEKDAIEPVFYYLLDSNTKNVFFQPGEKELQRYISEQQNAIVVQPLISKAPLQFVNTITTVTIEKLLVDLFCAKKLFNTFQGSELDFIFNSAYSRYAIDFSRLFSYAQRRKRKDDLRDFISTNTDIPKP